MGLGGGGFIPANSTAMLSDVPPHRLGIANAVRMMAQSSGVVISTALVLTIISAPLAVEHRERIFQGTISHVSRAAVDDLVVGYRWALGLMVAMSALCLLTSMVNRRVNTPDRATGTPVPIPATEE
jgi:MFS family permease